MKNIILIVALFTISKFAFPVCSSPISRTNSSANTVLTSTKLNLDFNTAYTRVNELPGDCVTSETITTTQILNGTIVNADIANATISNSKLASVNQVISSSSGTFGTTSGTFVDVTNLSVTITTTGRPVEIYLMPDGASAGYVTVNKSAAAAAGSFQILRDASVIAKYLLGITATGSTAVDLSHSPGSIRFTDTPAAGTYTYKLQAASDLVSSSQVKADNCKLVAREL